MRYPIATFSRFIVKQNGQGLIIRAEPWRSIFEKGGIFGFSFLLASFIISLIFLAFHAFPLLEYPLVIPGAIILTLVISPHLLSVPILQLDKHKKIVTEYGLDKFQAEFSAITDVSVVEELFQTGEVEHKVYRLKYTLSDGERTSIFGFTSYEEVHNLRQLVISTIAPSGIDGLPTDNGSPGHSSPIPS